jgi:hypothetical protein
MLTCLRVKAGEQIEADGRLVEAISLDTQEAALTGRHAQRVVFCFAIPETVLFAGEDEPVHKNAATELPVDTPINDRNNMASSPSLSLFRLPGSAHHSLQNLTGLAGICCAQRRGQNGCDGDGYELVHRQHHSTHEESLGELASFPTRSDLQIYRLSQAPRTPLQVLLKNLAKKLCKIPTCCIHP